jgi:ABC-type phosphate transport system substrate-binding protein
MRRFQYLVFLALLAFGALPAFGQEEIELFGNVQSYFLQSTKLAEIYTLSTQKWSDGSKIAVYDLKAGNPVKEKFYKFINKNPGELRKEWLRLQLTGEGKAPTAIKSEDEMLQHVSSTAGAIGYVSAAKVSDVVKVIAKID